MGDHGQPDDERRSGIRRRDSVVGVVAKWSSLEV